MTHQGFTCRKSEFFIFGNIKLFLSQKFFHKIIVTFRLLNIGFHSDDLFIYGYVFPAFT